MRLPAHQRVSDLLHGIADLVLEADSYLGESSLSPQPVTSLKKPASPGKSGIEPHAASGLDNRVRKMGEKVAKPERDLLRAKRERKQRSRYQAGKLTKGAPDKHFGTRFRSR